MKKKVALICALVGLALGFALGYVFHTQPADAPACDTTYTPRAKITDRGDAATIIALRMKIAQLEKALAARKAANAALTATNAALVAGGRPGGRGPGDPRRRLEELKETDPARYAQITNRMATWQARRAARARSRMEYLASIDVSHMSAGAKKTHGELQDLLAQREEIEQQLHDPNLSESDRKSLFDELHEMHGKINQLNRAERNNLLTETARELGLTGDDAALMTATIKDVIDATSSGHGGPHGPPPGQGGGAGGGGANPPPGMP